MRLQGHSGNVSCVQFSGDGARLLSGSWDTTLIIGDLRSGKQLRRLVGPKPVIWTNECGHPSGWPVAMWPISPPELDWLSIDQYDVLDGGKEVEMAQRYWGLKDVHTKLHPHQRLLAVPGTFACG